MAATSLRVMLLNVENLFSPGVNFYGSHYTEEQYTNKVNWLGSKIAEVQAHVVALVELGENAQNCINDIMSAANDEDTTGWSPFVHEFRAAPGKGSTKIRTAVISRFPLTNGESLVAYPDGFQVDLLRPGSNADNLDNWITVPSSEFSRPVGKVTVNPPNNAVPFNLFVVHLKSKRPKKSDHDNNNEAIGKARSAIQRNVEAAALRYHLDAFLPAQYQADNKVPSIVVGDFNDTPTSVPLENIRGTFDKVPGPTRAHPWSHADRLKLLSCARLHLKKSAYEDKLFSYVYNESYSLIDQALVTEHLVGKFTRMEVYNDHVFRHQDLSTLTTQEQQWKSEVSDHGAVVLEFIRMLKP
jgi:predicted extracellular nuclease